MARNKFFEFGDGDRSCSLGCESFLDPGTNQGGGAHAGLLCCGLHCFVRFGGQAQRGRDLSLIHISEPTRPY